MYMKVVSFKGNISPSIWDFNPQVTGGGGLFRVHLSFFLNVFQTNGDIGTKLSVPFDTLILHILTKQKFRTYHRSAGNDVRVTSCSIDFDAK